MNHRVIGHLLEIASAHPRDGVRTRHAAAVLDKKGRILGIGRNRKKSHPLQKEFAKNRHAIYLHAEIDAIRDAKRAGHIENAYELIIVRVKGHKNEIRPALSKPCDGCMKAIEAFGFEMVTFHDGNDFVELPPELL